MLGAARQEAGRHSQPAQTAHLLSHATIPGCRTACHGISAAFGKAGAAVAAGVFSSVSPQTTMYACAAVGQLWQTAEINSACITDARFCVTRHSLNKHGHASSHARLRNNFKHCWLWARRHRWLAPDGGLPAQRDNAGPGRGRPPTPLPAGRGGGALPRGGRQPQEPLVVGAVAGAGRGLRPAGRQGAAAAASARRGLRRGRHFSLAKAFVLPLVGTPVAPAVAVCNLLYWAY